MMRILLYILLGYMIWSIGRALWRLWLRDQQKDGYGNVHGQNDRTRGVEKPFSDIEDAEFEELDGDKRKES